MASDSAQNLLQAIENGKDDRFTVSTGACREQAAAQALREALLHECNCPTIGVLTKDAFEREGPKNVQINLTFLKASPETLTWGAQEGPRRVITVNGVYAKKKTTNGEPVQHLYVVPYSPQGYTIENAE